MFAWATTIYLHCLLTSVVCAWLLIRSYLRNKTPLLLWSVARFAFLALNNLVVVMDILIFPNIDLTAIRTIASLAGVSALLLGFIWEFDR